MQGFPAGSDTTLFTQVLGASAVFR
jgi:hypothetical protein